MDYTFDDIKEYARLTSIKLLEESNCFVEFGLNGTNKGWPLNTFMESIYNYDEDEQTIITTRFFLGTDGGLYREEHNYIQSFRNGMVTVLNDTKCCYPMTENEAIMFNDEFIPDKIEYDDKVIEKDINIGPMYNGRYQGLYVKLNDYAEVNYLRGKNDYSFSVIKKLAQKASQLLIAGGNKTQSFDEGNKQGWCLLKKYKSKYDRELNVEDGSVYYYYLGTDGVLYINIECLTYDGDEELPPVIITHELDSYLDAPVFNIIHHNKVIDEGRYRKDICFNRGFKYTGQNEGLFQLLSEIIKCE